jgi:hypothetical protein
MLYLQMRLCCGVKMWRNLGLRKISMEYKLEINLERTEMLKLPGNEGKKYSENKWKRDKVKG